MNALFRAGNLFACYLESLRMPLLNISLLPFQQNMSPSRLVVLHCTFFIAPSGRHASLFKHPAQCSSTTRLLAQFTQDQHPRQENSPTHTSSQRDAYASSIGTKSIQVVGHELVQVDQLAVALQCLMLFLVSAHTSAAAA